MNVCAIVPAFNEADVIAGVVLAARRHVAEVVVVDDGSTDETGARAAGAGAVCLTLTRNSGKGTALRHGLDSIRDRNFSHVLFMDGDGQHRPDDIPRLIDAARDGADIVIGTRSFVKGAMPTSRHFSNTIGSRAASWLVGQAILDSQSGFRLVRFDALQAVRLRARRYEFEMEVLIKLRARGATVAHAEVTTVYDCGQARSKMNPVRDTIRICLWSLVYRFGRG
jgi:glycosyltransferase involved in cell wall biosynthesis